MGDGRVEGILSVDVSDWETPGHPARKAGDVLLEARRSATRSGRSSSRASTTPASTCSTTPTCSAWFLDPAIVYPNPTEATNLEPLLINTAGSWADRPEAVTAIENLFLASDYVRTHTDLATMEGANEAARRAVNGILDAAGSSAAPLSVWKLEEPRSSPRRALSTGCCSRPTCRPSSKSESSTVGSRPPPSPRWGRLSPSGSRGFHDQEGDDPTDRQLRYWPQHRPLPRAREACVRHARWCLVLRRVRVGRVALRRRRWRASDS